MPEETQEQGDSRERQLEALKPYQYKKGQSGNPGGRPKGSKSLKAYAKEMLEKMTDEEREDFLHGLNKDIIWEMAEGKAQSNTDITSGGKPIPLFDHVSNNDRNPQDTKPL